MPYRALVFFLLFVISTHLKAADKPSYKGLLRIPVQLFTAQGTTLEIGQYELEAKPEKDDYVLT